MFSSMHLNLKGKTAVVTGAAGGMGLATITLLLKYNIHILALDIQKPNNKIFQNKKITYHEINLTDQTKLNEIVKNFVKKHKRIDYLVNTTGVLWFGKDVSAVDLDLEIWDSVFNINLKTMVLLSKAIIPVMKKISLDLWYISHPLMHFQVMTNLKMHMEPQKLQ